MPSKEDEQKNNDIFVLIVDNEIKGIFAGTTDPGVIKWKSRKTGETSDQLGGVAHLIEGDYAFSLEPGTFYKTRYHGYLESIEKYLPVVRDKNKDGFASDQDPPEDYDGYFNEQIPKNEECRTLADKIQIHFSGGIKWAVDDFSHGCQGIAGDRYFHNEYIFQDFQITPDGYYNGNHGAYNEFLKIIREGISGGENKIGYHLFHKDSIDKNYFNVKNWQVKLTLPKLELLKYIDSSEDKVKNKRSSLPPL